MWLAYFLTYSLSSNSFKSFLNKNKDDAVQLGETKTFFG